MSVAPVIANYLERLREAILAICVTRLDVDRKRIVNQLQELLFLVRPTVEADNAFGSAYAACCRLLETLKANDLSGWVAFDAVRPRTAGRALQGRCLGASSVVCCAK